MQGFRYCDNHSKLIIEIVASVLQILDKLFVAVRANPTLVSRMCSRSIDATRLKQILPERH